ncbi:unnamed protein product [Clonostachys rhizophaga]|uniref:FAD-binding PCMH-type domain-containing protein n=1 Tax=Clonostachys rhizophaga TaxID=160324 RepID=A0A9N9VV29_9HYPO|nr:unnamed protein product [Clonostachys rhizophaga]
MYFRLLFPSAAVLLVEVLGAVTGQLGLNHRPAQYCCSILKEETAVEHIYVPGDDAYNERVESYWSLTSQLTPACFVLPGDSQEVASVVRILVEKTECSFAVRSGGHSSNAGANNIEDGVTIDLSMMYGTTYDPVTELASVLPATNWLNVYNTLDPLGRGVPGGRLGDVGVGGLLLGGGFSLYLYRNGVACDNIRAMEVVLGNGTIVVASEDENADLFIALKGGAGNFGIVTRYDLGTFEIHPIWQLSKIYPEEAGQPFIGALQRWTDRLESYPNGSAIVFWSYRFGLRETIVLSGLSDITGREFAPAFDELAGIPGNLSFATGHSNMSTIALNEQAAGYRNIWWSLTLANDERLIAKAVELHHDLVEEMKVDSLDGDFETQCFFQPLPTIVGQKGPNILGIDRHTSNAIVLLASLAVNGEDQEAMGRKKMMTWKSKLEDYATSSGGLFEYIYMNYTDGSQDVIASYGKENLCKMWAVSQKYDPLGVMQSRQPGGFKLPADVSC